MSNTTGQKDHPQGKAGSLAAAPKRFVCILAVPRTGSNQLCWLLRSCESLNVKFEIFHPSWVGYLDGHDLEGLYVASNGRVVDDASLCAWRAANPGATLDELFKTGGERTIVFKLFPGHLTRNRIRSEIFTREDICYLMLRRRPIESFISSVKAELVKAHNNVDTTALKPVLDVTRFVRWAARTREWYDWVAGELAARARSAVEMTYERHLNLAENAMALSKALDSLATVGLAHPTTASEILTLDRQDREPRYQDRVANWSIFAANLRADRTLEQLLRWAETVP
jgi:LPS sulfotransferase NodH